MSPSDSIPRISWSSSSVILSYPRYSTKRKVIGGYCPESLLLLLISFIKASSSYNLLTMYLNIFDTLASALRSSLLSLMTPTPLALVQINISLLSIPLIFSIAGRLWILLSSFVFPDSAICFALSFICAVLRVEIFFLLRCSLFAFSLWWIRSDRSRYNHHFLTAIFASLVIVLWFTLLPLYLLFIRIFTRHNCSWGNLTVLE